jgi:hypothetical protein
MLPYCLRPQPPSQLVRNFGQYFTFTIQTITFGVGLPDTSGRVSLQGEIQAVTVGDTTFQTFTLAVPLPRFDKVRLWLAVKARSRQASMPHCSFFLWYGDGAKALGIDA